MSNLRWRASAEVTALTSKTISRMSRKQFSWTNGPERRADDPTPAFVATVRIDRRPAARLVSICRLVCDPGHDGVWFVGVEEAARPQPDHRFVRKLGLSRPRGSNPEPVVYKTTALPLS